MSSRLANPNPIRFCLAASALAAALAVGACDGHHHRSATEPLPPNFPSQTLVTQSRNVQGFTGVSLNGAGYVVIDQTGTDSLTITAPENIMPLLTSEVAGGMLVLDSTGDVSYQGRLEDVTYRITVAELHQILIAGAAAVDADGIDTSRLEISASGATAFSISGRADRQSISLAGAGSYDAPNLRSRETVVELAGSGRAVVRVSERLEGFVSFPCVLEYYGDPVVEVSGGGTVRRLGP